MGVGRDVGGLRGGGDLEGGRQQFAEISCFQ